MTITLEKPTDVITTTESFLVLWAGGYGQPETFGTKDRAEAIAKAEEWADSADPADWVQVIELDGVTAEADIIWADDGAI